MEKESGSEAAKAMVTKTLGEIFGEEIVAEQIISAVAKSWAVDPLTYVKGATHRDYGHPLLREPFSMYHFAGSETEAENGHVEGAVAAGERTAEEVIRALKQ